jgi:hypothetical protein
MDLGETKIRNDCAAEGQQKFNRPIGKKNDCVGEDEQQVTGLDWMSSPGRSRIFILFTSQKYISTVTHFMKTAKKKV